MKCHNAISVINYLTKSHVTGKIGLLLDKSRKDCVRFLLSRKTSHKAKKNENEERLLRSFRFLYRPLFIKFFKIHKN